MQTQANTTQGLTRRTIVGLATVSLASFALMALLFVRLSAAQNAVATAPLDPLIGHSAPAFAITTWNGGTQRTVRLADLQGHPVVVNFWASWCADCVDEEPLLQAAAQKYAAQGVQFVGIAFNDKQDAGTAFLKQHGVTYPCGPDAGTASVDYSVTGVPETIFVNAKGIVVSKSVGAVSDGSLDRAIQSLLRS